MAVLDDLWPAILLRLLYLSPYLVVELVGVGVAWVHFRRHPRPAVFLLVGCVAMILAGILGTTAPAAVVVFRSPPVDHMFWFRLIGWAQTGVTVAGIGMVIAAVFAGRRPAVAPVPVS